MIPILYNGNEQRFVNNGIGRLSDATRCVVVEERNGIYELQIDYPITGVHFDEIQIGRIIGATHDDRKDIQPFDIYKRTVPDLNGIVTFYAHHISYKLNKVTVAPFTAGSCAAALQGIKDNSINTNIFTFWTDKNATGNFECDEPKNARSMLAGEQGSILDVFGSGEYEFDRFTVKLHAARGTDSDCEIRYGKNLTALSEDIDQSGTFNAIVPFWKSSEGEILMLPEKTIVYEGLRPRLAYLTEHNLVVLRTETEEPIEVTYWEVDAVPMDMSDAFEEKPTIEQLRQAAKTRFESGEYWMPKENLTVDFVQLWQTDEYKDYAGLQRVRLCDTVSVYYPQVGISKVKQKVIKVEYNVLLDRYDSVELGSLQTTLGEQIREGILEEVPTTSMMDEAIRYATELIRGGLGGYVVMTPGPNGYPQEILIMDTPDINTAVNVWRFNQGGLGHSSNGYEGPYSDIALTQDGRINATMITSGILNANVIRAGIITDSEGYNLWNLDSGEFKTKEGIVGPFSVNGEKMTVSYTNFRNYFFDIFGLWMQGIVRGTADTNYILGITGSAIEFYGNYGDSTLIERGDDVINDHNFSIYQSLSANSKELRISRKMGGDPLVYFDYYDTTLRKTFPILFWDDVFCTSNFTVSGTKSRVTKSTNYTDRLLYAYETPTPIFGDIGEARLDEEGICYVDIDDIFTETIAEQVEYQVFLQKEGEGDCWIAEKNPRYFVIQGTPNLKLAWELKAKQRGYETYRLEPLDRGLDEYERATDPLEDADAFIREQEELLYG